MSDIKVQQNQTCVICWDEFQQPHKQGYLCPRIKIDMKRIPKIREPVYSDDPDDPEAQQAEQTNEVSQVEQQAKEAEEVVEYEYKEISRAPCNSFVCKSCIKEHLLSELRYDVSCPNCRNDWGRAILIDLDEDFYTKKFTTHAAKYILRREMSLMSQTMEAAREKKEENEKKEKKKKLIEKNKKKARYYEIVLEELRNVLFDENVSSKETQKIYDAIETYNLKILALAKERSAINKQFSVISDQKRAENKEARFQKKTQTFHGFCVKNGCVGSLVYSEDNDEKEYKCGLCKHKVCNRCRKEPHKGEKCKDEDLEQVAILSECKKCPNPACGVPIVKSDGCDQMCCTTCYTIFSWNTLQIQTGGTIHNPYAIQHQRNGGTIVRNHRDGCGMNFQKLELHMQQAGFSDSDINDLLENCRCVNHIREVVLGPGAYGKGIRPDSLMDYQDHRIRFMNKEISEFEFLNIIQMKEKAKEKMREIYMILQAYCNAFSEIILSVCENPENIELQLSQIPCLKEMTNTFLQKLHKRLKNKVPVITETWIEVPQNIVNAHMNAQNVREREDYMWRNRRGRHDVNQDEY